MDILKLRQLTAAYMQVPKSALYINVADEEDEPEVVDILLQAANNAKRFAQNNFDWNFEEVLVYGDAANGVGEWATAFQASDDAEVQVKQPQTFYIQEDTVLVPLYHHTKKHGATRARERLEARNYIVDRRYLTDDDAFSSQLSLSNTYSEQYEIFLLGNGYEIHPKPSETKRIYMDAFLWSPDYTLDTDTDFFLEQGATYMQWATIVEVNHLFQTFIPQQEGNISPPTRARDEALTALVEYNNFIVESGRQPR